MIQITLPDLTAYGFGGVTLVVALYLVLQAVKRNHPRLTRWMPEIVIAIAGILVATVMWFPALFTWLAGTIVTAALVITAHGGVKNVANQRQNPGGDDKAA